MEKTYFMMVEGKQVGPLVAQELKYHGLTPETFVWHEGLPDWVKAGTLPELAPLFAAPQQPYSQAQQPPYSQPQPPYSQQQPPYSQPQSNTYGQPQHPNPYGQQPPYSQSGYQPYGQPQGYGRQDYHGYDEPIPHTNWLPWAIVTTICGCFSGCIVLILGIIAIVKANKANQYYNMGNAELGAAANSTAKTLVIVGLILVGLGIIGIIVLWSNPIFKEAFQQAMLHN